MLKKLLITSFIFIGSTIALHAQTLKITDVDASEPKLFNPTSKRYLGKSMVITVYDNSVKIQLANEQPMILRKNAPNSYAIIDETSSAEESHRWDLTIETTVGVTTSATLSYTISEMKGSFRTAYFKLTGKRF